MLSVTVRVPAKINIVLAVGPLRGDGFHEVVTLYHAVSMFDEVTATEVPAGRAAHAHGVTGSGVSVDGPYAAGVPLGPQNLAVRAAAALAAHTGQERGVALHLRKGIPVAGGMAGGSADAAGALLACRALWGVEVSDAHLLDLAAALGSDVPFSLTGGTAVGTGRGERLAPVDIRGRLHWVVAVAAGELPTPAVFGRLDEIRSGRRVADPVLEAEVIEAVRAGDAVALAPLLRNDLQAAALELYGGLDDTLTAGRGAGALAALVSGSGPTTVFLARDAGHAGELADRLRTSGTCVSAHPVSGPAAVEY